MNIEDLNLVTVDWKFTLKKSMTWDLKVMADEEWL